MAVPVPPLIVAHVSEKTFEIIPPNLTPDPDTGHITAWCEDQFVARLKAGPVFGGSKMPWNAYRLLSEDDARSIYRYLRSVPPVKHLVGPTRREKGWKPPKA